VTTDDLGDVLAPHIDRQAEAERLYPLLVRQAARLKLRRLTFRCAGRRCLLLDAIETPAGIIVHQKRHKVSPPRNEAASNEAGRRANTFDGVNHWRPRTYHLGASALAHDDPGASLTIQCDHTVYRLTYAAFWAAWTGGGTVLLPE